MYEYAICNIYDKNVFSEQCTALEKHIPDMQKKLVSVDVDGSEIQEYMRSGSSVKVLNDKDFGVIIRSDFDIKPFFKA